MALQPRPPRPRAAPPKVRASSLARRSGAAALGVPLPGGRAGEQRCRQAAPGARGGGGRVLERRGGGVAGWWWNRERLRSRTPGR